VSSTARPAPDLDAALDRLRQSVAFVESWQTVLGNFKVDSRLDFVSLTGTSTSDQLDYDELVNFAAVGNRIAAEFSAGDWRAIMQSGAPGAFSIDVEGPFLDAFPDEETVEDAREAAVGDPRRFWDLCRGKSVYLTASIQHDPKAAGFHWVHSTDAFVTWAQGRRWLETASALYPPDGPHRLVIHDAGGSVVICDGYVVHGPETTPQEPAGPTNAEAATFAHVWLTDARAHLPSPQAICPTKNEGLDDVARLLTGLAWALCWGWLALELRTDTTGAAVASFQNAQITLQADPRDQATAELALWEWAVASTDFRRREALQQAISLAIRRTEDLADAAAPVRRMARYLLQVTEQGLITEALATRRSIREATMNLARTTGDAARTAARSTFDRALVQVAAAVGLFIAHRANAVSTALTVGLLLATGVLTGATALAALAHEFPSVSKTISAFRKDLEAYREVLTPEDLEEIKALPSLNEAEAHTTRARKATRVVLGGALVLLAAMLVATLWLGPPSSPPSLTPATSVTTTPDSSVPRTSVTTVLAPTSSHP
jgi:hypothetical protein